MHSNGPLPQVSIPKLKTQHLHIFSYLLFGGKKKKKKKNEPDSEQPVNVSPVLGISQTVQIPLKCTQKC